MTKTDFYISVFIVIASFLSMIYELYTDHIKLALFYFLIVLIFVYWSLIEYKQVWKCSKIESS